MLFRYLLSGLILGLCLNTFAVANETSVQEKDISYPYSEDDFSPCGVALSEEEINLLPLPKETTVGEVTYVSGGTCIDEVKHLKSIAPQYPLELVLVEEESGKEIYIADVHITLTNTEEKVVLDVVTEGPFLFVKLPEGEYQITADYNGVTQTKPATVHQKHTRLVFVWPSL